MEHVTIHFQGGPLDGTVEFDWEPDMSVPPADFYEGCAFGFFELTERGTVGKGWQASTPALRQIREELGLEAAKASGTKACRYRSVRREEDQGNVTVWAEYEAPGRLRHTACDPAE